MGAATDGAAGRAQRSGERKEEYERENYKGEAEEWNEGGVMEKVNEHKVGEVGEFMRREAKIEDKVLSW